MSENKHVLFIFITSSGVTMQIVLVLVAQDVSYLSEIFGRQRTAIEVRGILSAVLFVFI